MADIRPFRGIRFNSEITGDLSNNLCPTYVLSGDELERLYENGDYNIIRLELPYDWATHPSNESRYMRSARTKSQWMISGALRRDPVASMYVVEERFRFRRAEYRRIGLVSAMRVEDYADSVVLPHERTEPGPRADRLSLMRSSWANYSPLLCLFRDGRDAPVATLLWQIARREPDMEANPPDQPAIRAWCVTDAATLGALRGALADSQIYIADGHHRYEAAVAFRDYTRDDLGHGAETASQFRLTHLIAIDDPGLFLLGYHRGIAGATREEIISLRRHIGAVCHVQEWTPPQREVGGAMELKLARAPKGQMTFGVAGLEDGKFHIATMKRGAAPGTGPADLTDYGRLHQEIFNGIFGPTRELHAVNVKNSADQAVKDVVLGQSQMGFVMRAVPLGIAESVITKEELLPVKSTYFHPKPSAGLVIQSLEGEL